MENIILWVIYGLAIVIIIILGVIKEKVNEILKILKSKTSTTNKEDIEDENK